MNEKKFDLDDFLGIMLKENASDLYFKVGSVPHIRTGRGVCPISVQNISSADMELISRRIMNDEHKADILELFSNLEAHSFQADL